ncbi:MAG: GUN4 domain-containing protein [Nostoc sp. DedSLP03]|uniref:GUN4 domain-containing protein n=1 Tax=Nostoc sp. DedSLP03 TaxID=3075400 RepID=UPI002AD288F0|nr:GUN4 domain-containing protein [Nostoc sp. DedSLP03]MDZ7966416.1 GUN4 domain-containing protein [Nostoc sp. DedSLP03]
MMVQEIHNTTGEIITFYSYEDGTGCSTAVANVASILAQRLNQNGKVLMIDWDLETPVLHKLFCKYFKNKFNNTNNFKQALDNYPGLIDLFLKLHDDVTQNSKFAGGSEKIVEALLSEFDFQPFILETDIPSLYLLKAGCFDKKYSTKVNTFQWVNFYNHVPSLFRLLSEQLTKDYRYIVIDSHTGITDTSDICTMLMPEKLVTVFTTNRQSLEGVLDNIKQATDYRKQSDDLRPLVVFPLASRIELSEPIMRQCWRFGDPEKHIIGYQSQFEKLFQDVYGLSESECSLSSYFDEVQIQHLSHYSYGEEIAVLTEKQRDRLSLTRSYEIFTEKLLNLGTPWEYTWEQSRSQILILVALANTSRWDKEIRNIEGAIRRATRGDLFEIKTRIAIKPQDIYRAIVEEAPQIVHVCGDGMEEDGSLILEDDRGTRTSLETERLAALFKLYTDSIKCVLLNACYSAKLAEAISKHINSVIAINRSIEDRAAIVFAQGFYDALGYNSVDNQDIIQRAFEKGIVAIQLDVKDPLQGTIPSIWKFGIAQGEIEPLGNSNKVVIKEPPPDDLSKDTAMHYTQLRDLLTAKKWKEANSETFEVMRHLRSRNEDNSNIQFIACFDLRTINSLWLKYSNSNFGFSVQKNIYLKVGGIPDEESYQEALNKFGDQIGWRVEEGWISEDDAIFDLTAPQGHLPFLAARFQGKTLVSFLRHIYTCDL